MKKSTLLPVLDAAQSGACDKMMSATYHIPVRVLMEQAGKALADSILQLEQQEERIKDYARGLIPEYFVLCGGGNNGGDGLVLARHLFLNDRKVTVFLAADSDELKNEPLECFKAVKSLGIPIETAPRYPEKGNTTIIIDALLGSGTKGFLRPEILSWVDFYRTIPDTKVIAVDLPSGLDPSSGQIWNEPIPAIHTLALNTLKICHLATPAANYCGKVQILDIGIYQRVVEQQSVSVFADNNENLELPVPPDFAHKYSYGHVLVAGGCRAMPGAPALAAIAALKAGAGLCTGLVPESARVEFFNRWPEIMMAELPDADFLDERAVILAEEKIRTKKVNVIAAGPGMGVNKETHAFIKGILEIKIPKILDADALNILSEHKELLKHLSPDDILTPHEGEFARLTGNQETINRRLETAREFVQQYRCVLVLKGKNTLIVAPTGEAHFCMLPGPELATAGSGDVLTGCTAGLLARGLNSFEAACKGVKLHALAGKIAVNKAVYTGRISAEDIIACIGPSPE